MVKTQLHLCFCASGIDRQAFALVWNSAADIRSWAVQGNHKRHNEKAEFVVISRRQNLLTQKLLRESDQFRHVTTKAYE